MAYIMDTNEEERAKVVSHFQPEAGLFDLESGARLCSSVGRMVRLRYRDGLRSVM
jgi:hypothetical protein